MCGVGPQQVVDIKKITCLFWLKIRDLFGARKGDMGKSSESYNALFDTKKCDMKKSTEIHFF